MGGRNPFNQAFGSATGPFGVGVPGFGMNMGMAMGGRGSIQCMCDSTCVQYGDCCSDYFMVCLTEPFTFGG